MSAIGGGELLASAARTVTTTAAVIQHAGATGMACWLDISAIAGGSPGAVGTGLRLRLYGKSTSGILSLLLGGDDGPYLRKIGTWGWLWYPGAPFIHGNNLGTGGEGNVVYARSIALTEFWYLDVQHQDSTAYTYSLEYSYIAV